MSSMCCANCFSDSFIIKIIGRSDSFGRCYYCNKNHTTIISIDDLASRLSTTFENLVIMFEEDTHSDKLIDILDKEFEIFSKSTDKNRLKQNLEKQLPDTLNKKFKSVDIDDMHQQWDEFKQEIIHENRFFPKTSFYKQAFSPSGNLYNHFQQLMEELKHPIHPAEYFFRGRISDTLLPYTQMGKPPAKSATLGRANPYGISYLYLAQNKTTCIKEIRPNNSDTISIAKFHVTKELNVIDLREPREKISFLSLTSTDYIDILRIVSLLEKFTFELSLPVLPNNSQREYIPTQFITEFFKVHGNFDGVIFNSSYKEGYNLVLFSDDFCVCDISHNVEFVKIKGINFDHELA